MEKFIDGLISEFDSGKIGRREFCQTVGLAAAVYASGTQAADAAAPSRGFTLLGVNHLSYTCPDYRVARDFYASVFGMQPMNDKGMGRANLAFGPGVGEGGNFLVVHNPSRNPPPPPPSSLVDHVCFTIANWNEAAIRSELQAKGVAPTGRQGAGSLRLYDPFDFDIQFGNAVTENVYEP